MQFFAAHGLAGLAGVALSLVCFSYVCLTLFSSGRIHQLSRNEDVFRYYCGDYLGVFLTWYTMIFIVAVHAVMLAGAGAAIGQTFQVSGWPGSLVMGILVAATLILGLKQIVSVMRPGFGWLAAARRKMLPEAAAVDGMPRRMAWRETKGSTNGSFSFIKRNKLIDYACIESK